MLGRWTQNMQIIERLMAALVVAAAIAIGAPAARSDDTAASTRSRASRTTAARQAPARLAQVDSHGRYPFGQFRGGYRYPFSYPYYRYGPRHYPFGNGPYGPYGSNYGGYSGNAYDPGVYGTPVPDTRRGARVPRPPDAPPAEPEEKPEEREEAPPEKPARAGGIYGRPLRDAVQGYGDPLPYYGGNPFNPSYAGGQLFRAFPFGYYSNDMWFGSNHLIRGFGYYPTQNWSYFYGPPSGMGFYGPEYMPQYYNYSVRNYGPYYPGLGGINGGAGMYQGW